MSEPDPGPPLVLPPEQQDLYDHLVRVLEMYQSYLRRNVPTGDLVEEAGQAFLALDELVAPLRMPEFDTDTAQGRLMAAVARINREMPGVALRTLWRVHEYLSTSDDDGVVTRERALGIIQDLGLKGDGVSSTRLPVFPPLP